MFNNYHVPIVQFVADGDSRFRNHMLTMRAYTTNDNNDKFSIGYVKNEAEALIIEGEQADIAEVYAAGPEHGLIKKDIDIHNKSDQRSVERIISEECLHELANVPWARGTEFLVNVGKEGFEAWWKTNLTVIQRLQKAYYVAKVICLWEKWVVKAGLDASQAYITRELMRDTVIMSCGLLHLALMFKIYFPKQPFLPWKWSEYPLESYYSCIRFLNGNDDEFSTLEYLHRTKHMLTQQVIASKGTIKGRAKKKSREWEHPKEVRATDPEHVKFYSHDWDLANLLEAFAEADQRIVDEFKMLGMHLLLENDELYKVQSPKDRLMKVADKLEESTLRESMILLLGCDNVSKIAEEEHSKIPSRNEQKGERQSQGRYTTVPRIRLNGREMTVSAYVTVHKQRDDNKLSGLRNIYRFRQTDDDPLKEKISDKSLKSGDFFLSNRNNLVQIRQLRGAKKNFALTVQPSRAVFYLGITYRRLGRDQAYFALPEFTDKTYSNLIKNFKKKVNVTSTWIDAENRNMHCCKVEEGGDVGEERAAEDGDEYNEDSKHCFCRETGEKDVLIGCDNKDCRIKWFHLCCVGIESADQVPSGAYICPRCQGDDHWCTCGNKEENGTSEQDGGAQYCTCLRSGNFDELVRCTSTNCADEWFHKCCINVDREEDFPDWICDSCIGKK
eukprot:Seg968.2 transcript_id=Seg968.2/GoldUCD/mRNA.D3Y31 product="Inhibitor of growth protein 4" protein_id=Seg968.2/GoldUCD/D3Y31